MTCASRPVNATLCQLLCVIVAFGAFVQAEEQLSPAAQAALDALKKLPEAERDNVLKEFGAGSAQTVDSKAIDQAMDAKADDKDKGGDDKPKQPELYAFHYQMTAIGMRHGTFHSQYENPTTSLTHNDVASRTSLTATMYAGFHLWDGGEFYFDPELAGGEGFSFSSGIAGFPNGDITRVGKLQPTPYVARVFLRQTFGFGGETEQVESDANQLSGSRDINRLTLTIGKIAATDLFDGNSYSHDPRSQFMNWALMDQGAWDYAADARGYSPAVVADFNQKDWALRFGVFLVSDKPNGQNHDLNIPAALAYNLEFEYRYSICGHTGVFRPLAYLNRAHMGSYDEAVAIGQVNGATPTLSATRQYRIKYGASLNLEQKLIGDDFGCFARAGWDDGHTETWMFTAIDRSVSVGLSLAGKRWHRPNDTVGVAAVANGISGPHQHFLEAGGTDFIIGDGALKYGYERIEEVYYRLAIQKELSLTADYQRVDNPAYNRARGPVDIGGVRVHVEF